MHHVASPMHQIPNFGARKKEATHGIINALCPSPRFFNFCVSSKSRQYHGNVSTNVKKQKEENTQENSNRNG